MGPCANGPSFAPSSILVNGARLQEARESGRIVLKQKDGLSTLEMSKRHVGKMSMCMCGMFGVSGTFRPLGSQLPEEDIF